MNVTPTGLAMAAAGIALLLSGCSHTTRNTAAPTPSQNSATTTTLTPVDHYPKTEAEQAQARAVADSQKQMIQARIKEVGR